VRNRLGIGLIACWASTASLPVGLMAIGGGPCFGPRDAFGSIVLLFSGIGGMSAAGYGIDRVSRGLRQSSPVVRVFGGLSALAARLAALIEVFYLWIGVQSLQVYLRM
jgi:hypothetical protein